MEAKLQDMNSILRKVVPQGIAAAANSCREQISFIYLISVLWRARVLGFCSGCSTTSGQLHGSSGWSSYLAALEELSSSFILSFGGPVLHPYPSHSLFQPALSLSAVMLLNDRHPSLSFEIEALACAFSFSFFFFLFLCCQSSRSAADHRALFCPVSAVIHV